MKDGYFLLMTSFCSATVVGKENSANLIGTFGYKEAEVLGYDSGCGEELYHVGDYKGLETLGERMPVFLSDFAHVFMRVDGNMIKMPERVSEERGIGQSDDGPVVYRQNDIVVTKDITSLHPLCEDYAECERTGEKGTITVLKNGKAETISIAGEIGC